MRAAGAGINQGRAELTQVLRNFMDLSSPASSLVDPFGRAIDYLRVSVTDRCDFRCVYCMSEHMTFLPKKDLLTLEELDRLCSAFVAKGHLNSFAKEASGSKLASVAA